MANYISPQRRLFILGSLLLLVIIVGVITFYRYINVQDVTPEDFINLVKDAGYEVINIRNAGDEHPGPMYVPEYGIRFDFIYRGDNYNIFVVKYNEMRKAIRSSRLINNLDNRMNGGYAYSFSYGTLLVQICPSNKDLGKELLSVIKDSK